MGSKKGVQYRDRQGRLRLEDTREGMDTVQIVNGPDGFMAILLPSIRQAVRFRLAPGEPVGFSTGGIGGVIGQGSKNFSMQKLGSRIIEGIEFDGELTTATLAANPALVATEERWYSQALGLIGLMVTSGPEGRTTARIHGIVREDPAPSLFQVPEGYEVQDVPSQVVPKAIP